MEPRETTPLPTTPEKSWWHPNYAIALAIVFASSVAAFLISPEAGRFVTVVFTYAATLGGIFLAVLFFTQNSKGDLFMGGMAFLCVVGGLLFAVLFPLAGIDYIATGVLK